MLKTYRHLDRPKQILKRGNTCGDPAAWDAWMVVLRASGPAARHRLQHEDEDSDGEGNDASSNTSKYQNSDAVPQNVVVIIIVSLY